MNEKRTTARAFHDAFGVDDWRVLSSGLGLHVNVVEVARDLRDFGDRAHGVDIAAWPDVEDNEDG